MSSEQSFSYIQDENKFNNIKNHTEIREQMGLMGQGLLIATEKVWSKVWVEMKN